MTTAESTVTAADLQTITVKIRDRSAEPPWGTGGPITPIVRIIEISANCPVCGAPRGERRNLNQCEDGAHYSVDIWDNPCGHVDKYTEVVKEAATLVEKHQDELLGTLQPGDRITVTHWAGTKYETAIGDVVEVNLNERKVFAKDGDDQGWVPIRYITRAESAGGSDE